jgi:hypothetical protein
MRFALAISFLLGSSMLGVAQTTQSPLTPSIGEDLEARKQILQVCTQKADLNARLLPRDRPKYITDCINKAQIAR